MLLFAVKYKFMTLWLNTSNSSTLPGLFHLNLAPFKFLTNCKDFPRSLNGESGRASHLVYKFDKQIARRNNSQIKIFTVICLNSHTYHLLRHQNETANDVLAEQNVSKGDELSTLTN